MTTEEYTAKLSNEDLIKAIEEMTALGEGVAISISNNSEIRRVGRIYLAEIAARGPIRKYELDFGIEFIRKEVFIRFKKLVSK